MNNLDNKITLLVYDLNAEGNIGAVEKVPKNLP
jgi:hypothetical protein